MKLLLVLTVLVALCVAVLMVAFHNQLIAMFSSKRTRRGVVVKKFVRAKDLSFLPKERDLHDRPESLDFFFVVTVGGQDFEVPTSHERYLATKIADIVSVWVRRVPFFHHEFAEEDVSHL